jgi:hypothetical protein
MPAMGAGPLQAKDLFLQRLLGKFSSLYCSGTARITYSDNRLPTVDASAPTNGVAGSAAGAEEGKGEGAATSFYSAVDGCVSEADVSDVGKKTVHTLALMERKVVAQTQNAYTYILVAHFAPCAAFPDKSVSSPPAQREEREAGAAQLLEDLAAVLSAWTNLPHESVLQVLAAAPSSEPQRFEQAAVFEPAPLSPALRESGCVVASEDPPLLLSGDWATGSGTVSGAILSGERAAEVLVQLLLSREDPQGAAAGPLGPLP